MFNIAQVVGNGTTQTLFTFDEFFEGSIHSLQVDNIVADDKTVTVIVGSLSFSIPAAANAVNVHDFKINIPNSTAVIVNAPVGVTVTASYIKQAIDSSAALTEAQALIASLPEGAINDTAASTANTYSSTKINDLLTNIDMPATGADIKTSATDIQLTNLDVLVQSISFTADNKSVILPSGITKDPGFAFIIHNSGQYLFTIRDSSNNGLDLVKPGESIFIMLSDNDTSTGNWSLSKGIQPSLLSRLSNIETFLASDIVTTGNMSSCFLTDSKVALTFRDNDDTGKLKFCIINIIDGEPIAGTVHNIVLDDATGGYNAIDRVSDNKAIIAYHTYSGSIHNMKVAIIDLDGSDVPTLGSPENINTYDGTIEIKCLSETKAIVCSFNATTKCEAVIVNISGSSLTVNTPFVFNTDTNPEIKDLAIINSSTVCVLYKYGSNMIVQILDIDGNSITGNTPYVIVSASYKPSIIYTTNNQIAYAAGYSEINVGLLTISNGNVVSHLTSTIDIQDYGYVTYINDKIYVLAHSDASLDVFSFSYPELQQIKHDRYSVSNGNYYRGCFNTNSNGDIFHAYRVSVSPYYGECQVYEVAK